MFKIPSRNECLKLMKEYGMPENIKAHCFKVRDVSVFLAKELNKKGEELDIRLIESSALLHDISKMYCKNSNKRHDEVGAGLLKSLGYEKVADIVEQHVVINKKLPENITEEEVINYADKRVMHDKIVSISKRFEDIKERYASPDPDMTKRIDLSVKEGCLLEKRIFKNLDFSPDDLVKVLEK